MSEQTGTEAPTTEPTEAPATEATETKAPQPGPSSLEDLLAEHEISGDLAAALLDATRKPRREAQNLRTRMAELEAKATKLDELEAANLSEAEKAQRDLESAREQIAELTTRAAKSEIKRLAADSFTDPEDALGAVDPAEFTGKDGEVDTEKLAEALEEVLARKPHWRKAEAKPKLPKNLAQGGSSEQPAPQLSREDMKTMSPAEIVAAEKAGQFDDLLKKK